ncbi:TetR/AcrR family transcriptional regulator [Staphylococcus cohnii]|uniref:TetR/AcrR family transcriptional regulator n=1 Tax=Staphylococcus cohnii TaxID=29382 RepID=UPI003D7C4646
MNVKFNDEDLLSKIAIAMVQNPRSTLKELAEHAGISNATLYRFCGSRDNLDNILLQKSESILDEIIKIAIKDYDNYVLGLDELIKEHYKNNEILQLLFSLQITSSQNKYDSYFESIDNFFLQGQKNREFRIDLNANFLTTVFTSSIYGLINAKYRGRVASTGLEASFKDFFLSGAYQNE